MDSEQPISTSGVLLLFVHRVGYSMKNNNYEMVRQKKKTAYFGTDAAQAGALGLVIVPGAALASPIAVPNKAAAGAPEQATFGPDSMKKKQFQPNIPKT